MTTHELLELASLDALGLLDEEERESFERAFRSAPPALQAQMRREQARMARVDAILPDVQPPPGLRARVLAAVREAMQVVTSRRSIAGQLGPLVLPSRGVTPLWRAAAVGCAAAAIVFALTFFHIRASLEEVNSRLSSNMQSDEWIKEYGARFEQMLMNPSVSLVHFDAAQRSAKAVGSTAAPSAKAVLLLDRETNTGQLICRDLPADAGEYSLCVVDEKGEVVGEALVTFRFSDNKKVNGVKLGTGQRLAIMAPGKSGSAPQAAVLMGVRS